MYASVMSYTVIDDPMFPIAVQVDHSRIFCRESESRSYSILTRVYLYIQRAGVYFLEMPSIGVPPKLKLCLTRIGCCDFYIGSPSTLIPYVRAALTD